MSPAGMSPNSPWPEIIKFFPARESLVSDIPAGDGKTFFYSVLSQLMTMGGGGEGSSQVRRQKNLWASSKTYFLLKADLRPVVLNWKQTQLEFSSLHHPRPWFLSVCNCLKIHLGSVMVRDGQHLQGRSCFFYILFCNCYFMKVVFLKIIKEFRVTGL